MTNWFGLFLPESSLIIAHCVYFVCSSTSQFGQLFLVNRFFITFVVVIISTSLFCSDAWSFTSESCPQSTNTFHYTSSEYLPLCSSLSVRLYRHRTAIVYRRHHRQPAHRYPPAAEFYFYLTHCRIESTRRPACRRSHHLFYWSRTAASPPCLSSYLLLFHLHRHRQLISSSRRPSFARLSSYSLLLPSAAGSALRRSRPLFCRYSLVLIIFSRLSPASPAGCMFLNYQQSVHLHIVLPTDLALHYRLILLFSRIFFNCP